MGLQGDAPQNEDLCLRRKIFQCLDWPSRVSASGVRAWLSTDEVEPIQRAGKLLIVQLTALVGAPQDTPRHVAVRVERPPRTTLAQGRKHIICSNVNCHVDSPGSYSEIARPNSPPSAYIGRRITPIHSLETNFSML
jgi:hypothetical protein